MLASSRLLLRRSVARGPTITLSRRRNTSGEIPVENKALIDPMLPYKNAGLAAALLTMVGGIMWYSMNAVGQAGTSEDGQDPLLAALEEESQLALSQQQQQQETTQTTQEMFSKFQSGEYDPDVQEQRELEAELELQAGKKKRPWWKVW